MLSPRITVALTAAALVVSLLPATVAQAADLSSRQWNVYSNLNAYGSQASAAWPTTRGAGATVGVLDTGITPHPDLTGSTTTLVGGNAVAGYDFVSDPSASRDGDGWDADPTDTIAGSWHGLHVSGIVAALDNGDGITGVAPSATLVPIRVVGNLGAPDVGSMDDAIRWGAGIHVAGAPDNAHPADVLNMSIGTQGPCPAAVQSAINDAVNAGTAIVVAAGNTWSGGTPDPVSANFPANCNNVIRVTASTDQGVLTTYSNLGTDALPATIAAPGDVWSTCGLTATDCTTGYAVSRGTSMAAPHVAGVIALMRSVRPDLSVAQLIAALTGPNSVTPFATTCPAARCGAGLLNAPAAVAAAEAMPRTAAPTDPPPVVAPVVTGPLPAFTAPTRPSMRGTFRVGHRISAVRGVWKPKPTSYAYRWYRSGKKIAGATHSTYKLVRADRGKKVSVKVTVRRSGYRTTTVASRNHIVR